MSLLKADALSKRFVKNGSVVTALDKVSFSMEARQSLGIVGESGSGKTTLANILTCFEKADSGRVCLRDKDITDVSGKAKKEVYRQMQMVFQDPRSSFDPKYTIGRSILEAAENFGIPKETTEASLSDLFRQVGLKAEYAGRRPGSISGGECQRAAIARALMIQPSILVCDEITAALDVSVQAHILALLDSLKAERDLSYLFISHDIAVVSLICEKLLVLYQGRVMEYGPAKEILDRPLHPYTRLLLSAASGGRGARRSPGIRNSRPAAGKGCPFQERCPYAAAGCGTLESILHEERPGHFSACPVVGAG